MSSGQETPSYHTSEDEQILHKLGYAQELFRAMGGFRNFAISFTIISILAGCLDVVRDCLRPGRAGRRHLGVAASSGLMSTLVALSMAEIASAYPTAGGLYYWASKLGSPGWGWFTGWFNLVGQIAVTAAIGYGLAIFGPVLLELLVRLPEHERLSRLHLDVHPVRRPQLAAVLITCSTSRHVELNTISAYWHMIGVGSSSASSSSCPTAPSLSSSSRRPSTPPAGWQRGPDIIREPRFWYVFDLGS